MRLLTFGPFTCFPSAFHNRFGVSIVPFVWRDLQRHSTCSKVLRCSPRQSPEGDPFYMQVCCQLNVLS